MSVIDQILLDFLKINKLQEANKKLKDPYPAVLEVILSYMVVNDILVKSHTFNIKAIQVQEKVVADKKMGNKQFGKLYKNIGEEYFQNSLFFKKTTFKCLSSCYVSWDTLYVKEYPY